MLRTLAAAAVAAAFVGTHAKPLGQDPIGVFGALAGELPSTIEALTSGASGIAVKGTRPGKHMGFDTYAYPGDEVMNAWRHESVPYEWVGYYLPAPCHKGTTWVGKRERLAAMGWGMAVIYVGQQTWDKTPTGYETHYKSVRKTVYQSKRVKVYRTVNGKRVARYVTRKVPVKKMVRVPVKVRIDPIKLDIDKCNAQLVSATRGKLEAADAIRRTQAEGFPRGAVIYLDIEYMRAVPQKMRDYYRAWTAAVLADGRYRPGYYVHDRNAQTIYRDVIAVYAKAGITEEPPFWVAGGNDFSPDESAPTDVGHQFAHVWQGELDVVRQWLGHAIALDVNVAAVPDPSHRHVLASDPAALRAVGP
jgi:hypothetical protein